MNEDLSRREVEAATGLPTPAAARALRELRDAWWVETARDGSPRYGLAGRDDPDRVVAEQDEPEA